MSDWYDLDIPYEEDPVWCAFHKTHEAVKSSGFFAKRGVDEHKVDINIRDRYTNHLEFDNELQRIIIPENVFAAMTDREKPAYISQAVALYYENVPLLNSSEQRDKQLPANVALVTAVNYFATSPADMNGAFSFIVLEAALLLGLLACRACKTNSEIGSARNNADYIALNVTKDPKAVFSMVKKEGFFLGCAAQEYSRCEYLKKELRNDPDRYEVEDRGVAI